jgi:hypothetical protein
MTAPAHSGAPSRGVAWLALLCLANAGCNSAHLAQDETPDPSADPNPNGSKEQVGQTADQKPVQNPPAQQPVVFTARLEGDDIVVELSGEPQQFVLTCAEDLTQLEKREDNSWVNVYDDRPAADSHDAYFLDDMLIPEEVPFGFGCDVQRCISAPTGARIAAYEYVNAGTRAPPADFASDDDAGLPDSLPVIKTRPLSGPVRITLHYFSDAGCRKIAEARVELTIPAR